MCEENPMFHGPWPQFQIRPVNQNVNEKFEPASLEQAIRMCIAPIDAYLVDLRVPIPDRVLDAARMFVDHCVIEIKGDSKDDYIQKGWFQFIFRTTRSWYEEKYGSALKRPEAVLVGACEIEGSSFQLHVPIIVRRAGEPGQTVWLVFPVDLQPEENVATWFVSPPNFDVFEASIRTSALENASAVGGLLRRIHSDLMTAKRPDDIALAEKIQSHLVASAQYLTEPRRPVFGLAVWESHQAVESALKLLNRQYRGQHSNTHELLDLFHDVSGFVSGIHEDALRKMPSQRRAIKMRAGEGAPVSPEHAYKIYRMSLNLTTQLVSAMPREIVMRNAQFHLKKAPFI